MCPTPNFTVPALEKRLDVVESMAAVAVPLSLAELGVQLDRGSSELFRILNRLEQRGYVGRDEASGKYGLTLKLYSLAHAHSVAEKLLRAAQLPMQVMTESIRESCHLSVLDGGKLLVIARQESPERVRISIEVGALFDPVETASGRLLLAQLNDSQRAAALAEARGDRIPSAADRATLGLALGKVRKRAVSTVASEPPEGVRDVAVLVGSPAANITGALAITRLQRHGQRDDESALIEKLHAAAEITRKLGSEVAA